MSRFRIGIAVVVLATLLSSAAPAGVRLGISPLGVARFAVGRVLSLGGLHHRRAFARHGQIRTASLRPQDVRIAMDSGLGSPAARRQIVAAAALAGWHGGRDANGWWRHGDGGYGWVGPLFWPFAIYDIYDYAVWGDGTGFWDYGYPDIYAAIFAPYGHDDLAAYAGRSPHGPGQLNSRHLSSRYRRVPLLQQLCGDDRNDVAGLAIDQMQQAIQPNEVLRAALDGLANALIPAAQMIQASCPTQTALTAPGRLAVMQQRIGAMIMAASAVQQPLGKFYDLLEDEQEARLNALAEDRRKISAANGATEAPAQACGVAQPAALQWPADEIEARLHPNDTQRAALKALQDANARAVDILNAGCQPDDATTPPARLDAMQGRLEALQRAVYLVSVALENFYATLSDEQKAQFEAIGQKRTA
ncbi:Spy/CpxP family protein refolding chaperone [Bradyrhizobium sp. Ash2021]|uniref:Spy/CpxP family protein refolding chaperone n=1 Tax=Bradyrhizobium sp. Ash2021 TaxID=2954771 RepID=UPI002815F5D1|nr:Spy/CpxP family protein refolding chaperone [Bradyrhizobium sp. Ash2021]WMT73660.1 Spy/CpxP family protein refolding chaperone [Bradyrhizobium sp. Ash2021]